MSFRQSFTRGGNENLQYDDAASYHFFMTVLIIAFVPLGYSILKSALFPFSHMKIIKSLEKESSFKDKIAKYKKENRYKFFTFGYVLKIVLAVFLGYLILNTYQSVRSTNDQMKGFDPYEILEVSEAATINEIRKAYRRLALQYHPDRNDNDPQSAAMFIMISKAYQCLTDDKAKQNCLKFGNPEGTNSFNVGIALPQILVRKQNQIKVMVFVLVIMVILIPSILIYWNSSMDSVDEQGALIINHPQIIRCLNENLSVSNVLSIVSTSWQFKKFRTKRSQLEASEQLFNQIDLDVRNSMNIKKEYYNFFKKSFVLIDAHMNSRKIPAELAENFAYVLQTVPKLMNSIINISLPISTTVYKVNKHPQQKFVGITALESLIWFEQRFIQGSTFDSPQISQLNLSVDELDKVRKKRRTKMPTIKHLQRDQQQNEKFLALFEEYRKPAIKKQISMFPMIDLSATIYTPEQQEIYDRSLVEVKIVISRSNPIECVLSNKYPYLKQQRWYLFIVQKKALHYYTKFTFQGQKTKQFIYNHPIFIESGSQQWRVILMPDSYFGFDQQFALKFKVVKTPSEKKQSYKPHPQDAQINSDDLFSRLLNMAVPQEQEQQLSESAEEQKNLEEIPSSQK